MLRKVTIAAVGALALTLTLAVASPAAALPPCCDDGGGGGGGGGGGPTSPGPFNCVPPSYVEVFFPDPTQTRRDWDHGFDIVSVTSRFEPSEGRFVTNNTGSPISVTFTSSVAMTRTVSTTLSLQETITRMFTNQVVGNTNIQTQFGLSRTLTTSTSTNIGVNTTATAPPFTTLQGRYGINVYDFVVRFFVFFHKTWSQPGVQCVIQGQTGNALLTNPTVDQGWQIQQL